MTSAQRAAMIGLFLVATAAAVGFGLSHGEPSAPPGVTASKGQPDREAAVSLHDDTRPMPPRAQSGEVLPRAPVVDPGGPGLRGRLLQSGAPLADCRIEAWRNYGRRDPARLTAATSGADGVFVLPGMADQVVTLVFTGASVPSPWLRKGARVPPDHVNDLGDIDVPIGASVRGRVLDPDGLPIAGVPVLHDHRPGYSMSHFDRRTPQLSRVRNRHVVTGDDGTFSFDMLPPGNHHVLIEPVASDDHRERELHCELTAGDHHDFGAITLSRGVVIAGHVYDTVGRAVADARVAPVTGSLDVAALRRGVSTAVDGSFELRGQPERLRLTVEADGFQPPVLSVNASDAPLVIELVAALKVHGVVRGQRDAVTTVVLESDPGAGRLPPKFVYGQLGVPHRVAPDGSFHIGQLAAANYKLRAHAEGVGVSEYVHFALPLENNAPIEVPIIADIHLEVRVVDDLNAPVTGARVVRDPGIEEYPSLYRADDPELAKRVLKAWRRTKRETLTDGAGIARLPVEPNVALAIAAEHDLHLAAATVVAAANRQDGATVTLTLPRAGRITGVLDDATGKQRFSLRAACCRVADDGTPAEDSRLLLAVDDRGWFGSGPLAPGNYRVAIYRYNMTWQREPSRRLPNVTPLLGGGTDPRQQVEVAVRPGETTEVPLAATALGSIRGTVRRHGTAVAGAIVFAVEEGAERTAPGRANASWQDDGAHLYVPYTTTATDGSFTFLYAEPGSWDFRARAADAPYPVGPVRVVAARFGQHLVQDLELAGADISGRLELEPLDLTDKERRRVSAYLFPLSEAHRDPFYMPHHGLPQTASLRDETLDNEGRFTFHAVPPGDWVLRLVAARDRLLYQQTITTGSLPIDLGSLRSPTGVVAKLRCPDKRIRGIWLRAVSKGSDEGIFVATVPVDDGTIPLPALQPGKYLVEPFEGQADFMAIGLSGASFDIVLPIEVRADGTVDPDVITVPQ